MRNEWHTSENDERNLYDENLREKQQKQQNLHTWISALCDEHSPNILHHVVRNALKTSKIWLALVFGWLIDAIDITMLSPMCMLAKNLQSKDLHEIHILINLLQ